MQVVSDATRRVYVVAGVYGCFQEFEQLLLKISDDGFDIKQDELVILGPLLGPGPSVDLVFEKLSDLREHKVRLTHVLSWVDAVFNETVSDESIFECLKQFERADSSFEREADEQDVEHFNYLCRWAAFGGHTAAFAYAERGKIAIPTSVTEILAQSVKYYRTGRYLFIPAPVPRHSTDFRSAIEELERDEVLCPIARHGRVGGDPALMALPVEDGEAFVIAGGDVVTEVTYGPHSGLIDTGVFSGGPMTAIRLPDFRVLQFTSKVDYRTPIPYNFVREGVPIL